MLEVEQKADYTKKLAGALAKSVKEQLISYIGKFSRLNLVLAVSGGSDSIVLLDLIGGLYVEYPAAINLCVVHVNHGLSTYADDWQYFVEDQCSTRGIQCFSRKVALDGGANLEERARQKRYKIFQQIIESWHMQHNQSQHTFLDAKTMLVLGHHANDVAENYLLRLMRGAGPLGLSDMKPIDDHHQGFTIWRPMFNFTKAEIESYIDMNHLLAVDDESNADERFNRNYIRHEIMPLLTARWHHAVASIQSSHMYCQEAVALSNDIASIDYEACGMTISPAHLPALCGQDLLNLAEYRSKNVIRYWLKQQGVDQLRHSLFAAIVSGVKACVETPSSRQRLKIAVDYKKSLFLGFSQGLLYLYRDFGCIKDSVIPGPDFNGLQAILGVSFTLIDKDQPILSVKKHISQFGCANFSLDAQEYEYIRKHPSWYWRVARLGEKIHLESKPYPMKLTKLWLEWRVPSALRSQWPLLVDQDNQVVFIPGCYSKLNNNSAQSRSFTCESSRVSS